MMIIKQLIDEDFLMYKKPSMHIGFPNCTFKCDREYGGRICQNSDLAKSRNIVVPIQDIIQRYVDNPITRAIVLAGLEPFDDFIQLKNLIRQFRAFTNDDIIIYTGYNRDEIEKMIMKISRYENIIVKFGRYVPNSKSVYDDVLGVELASENQHAEKIS